MTVNIGHHREVYYHGIVYLWKWLLPWRQWFPCVLFATLCLHCVCKYAGDVLCAVDIDHLVVLCMYRTHRLHHVYTRAPPRHRN